MFGVLWLRQPIGFLSPRPLGPYGLWSYEAFGALWHLEPFGNWSPLAFEALWHLEPFGFWSPLAFGAFWLSAP